MTRTCWSSRFTPTWKKLQKDYAPLRGTPMDGLAPANKSMPYHPGAIKYYKEAGLWTAGHDAGQTRP